MTTLTKIKNSSEKYILGEEWNTFGNNRKHISRKYVNRDYLKTLRIKLMNYGVFNNLMEEHPVGSIYMLAINVDWYLRRKSTLR